MGKSLKSSRMRSSKRPSTAATRQQHPSVWTPKTPLRKDADFDAVAAIPSKDKTSQDMINEYVDITKSKVLTPRKRATQNMLQ